MEENGIGRNLDITEIDGTKWNWKEHGIYQIERNGNGGNIKISKQMEGNGI